MSEHPRYDEAMKSGHWTPERCAKAFEKELHDIERENAKLREALSEIHVAAHCISKAGPLNTPTLADAWSQFDRLAVMATAALAATTHSNLKLD